ncbi:MAG: hypothetical protein E8D45_12620 [Nitrospira sp.]|nr:MAG: hypothetical protein E8D45_12620 [Nitrospira sp.]
MILLTSCASGLLAATLWSATPLPMAEPEDLVPEECAVLRSPLWTLEATIMSLRDPEPGQAEGVIAYVQSAGGCEADLLFAAPDMTLQVGDVLRISGATREGLVAIAKVLRLVRQDAM